MATECFNGYRDGLRDSTLYIKRMSTAENSLYSACVRGSTVDIATVYMMEQWIWRLFSKEHIVYYECLRNSTLDIEIAYELVQWI
jgi:hypothetical protein